MEERNFWLLLSVIIIGLSGILILVVGYIYFVVVPRPKISTSTPFIVPTNSPTATATQPAAADYTNTPIQLNIITATPSITTTPRETELPSPTETAHPTDQPATDQATSLPGYGSPEEFMRSYYTLINQREYNRTFAMLSNNFKNRFHCCNPDGSYQIEPYIDWWNSIDEVTVLWVKTNPKSDNSAQVTVSLIYDRVNGNRVENTQGFDLIFDRTVDSWLID